MWESIKYVSSGITLIAFIAAVVAWSYKAKINEKERLLKSIPEKDRSKVVSDILEFLRVDPGNLTKNQQYDLAIRQIDERTKRYLITTIAVVVLLTIGAIVTIYALMQSSEPSPPTLNSQQALGSASAKQQIAVSCPQGKAIRLYKYYGSDKKGFEETYEQLKGILFDKVSVIVGRYAGVDNGSDSIESLYICMMEKPLESANEAQEILMDDNNSLEISMGTLFFEEAAPVAKSRIYFVQSNKVESFSVSNKVSASEFNSIRDEFTVITLFALAQDAKKHGKPSNIVFEYLSDAYMIANDLSNDKFKKLISDELSNYETSTFSTSG